MKKIPYRTCIITKEKLPKDKLIRVVRTPNGEVKVDKTGKMNGRGAYLKREKAVILKSLGALSHYLNVDIAEAIIEELVQIIDEVSSTL